MWDLVFRPGMELGPLHWEDGVLATGLPGKSWCFFLFSCLELSLHNEGLVGSDFHSSLIFIRKMCPEGCGESWVCPQG